MENTANIQSSACYLHINPPILIVGLYRSPNSTDNEDDMLILALMQAHKSSYRLVILGDFNAPHIDWKLPGTLRKGFDSKLHRLIQELTLEQHVKQYTRFRQGQRPSLLDLVITRRPNDISDIHTITPLGRSDHAPIIFKLRAVIAEPCKSKSRCFHSLDEKALLSRALTLSWNIGGPINEVWDNIQNNVSALTETFVPLRAKGTKGRKPWFRPRVRRALKKKRTAWNVYVSHKTYRNFSKYKRTRNEAIKITRKARLVYETKLAKSARQYPKRYFGYLQARSSTRKDIGNALLVNGNLLTTDKEIANAFLSAFLGVYRQDTLPDIAQPPQSDKMGDLTVTSEDVDRALASLNTSKSHGPDEIHPAVIKPLGNILKPILVDMFNLSLNSCEVPSAWKEATVVPIFKDGDRSNPSNYRPISLTSVIAKMLERILRDKICAYLVSTNFFSDAQHGFIRGRSCLSNLLKFLDIVTDKLDKGLQVNVCYLDFQKAFDSVNHRLLYWKLQNAGLSQNLCNWINEFLRGRTFRVKVRDSLSDIGTPISGVPQGSILGPLMFLIYINDITENLENPCLLYADDLKLVGDTSNSDALQRDIYRVCEWANKWDLPINVVKSHLLTKMPPDFRLFIRLGDCEELPLSSRTATTDLGVSVSNDFTPTCPSGAAAAKARRALFSLKAAIVNKSPEVFAPLYSVFVRPHLEYCVQAWSPYLLKDIKILEGVQRQATRMIWGMKGLSYKERLKALNLFSLERRRLRGDLIEVFKMTLHMSSSPITDLFVFRPHTGLRGHKYTLEKVRSKLAIRYNFFSNRVVNSWNRLPSHLISCTTVDSFKRELDKEWLKLFPDIS